jgi:hypothetical protein
MFFQSAVSNLSTAATDQAQITQGLHRITEALSHWAIPIAAVGTVSMAILQSVKNQTPIRNWYQKLRLRKWLLSSIRGDYSKSWIARLKHGLNLRFPSTKDEEHKLKVDKLRKKQLDRLEEVEDELIALATSGDREAFYDLPIDGLCDQIRKIVSVILDYPNLHEMLLRVLARGASSSDIALLLNAQATDEKGQKAPTKKEATDNAQQTAAVVHAAPTKDEAAKAFREITAAKSRVLSQIRCSVDAMQISIGFRWKFWLQSASMVLSTVIGAVAFGLKGVRGTSGAIDWAICGRALGFGVLAGFLAPIARDLVASTEKWRS